MEPKRRKPKVWTVSHSRNKILSSLPPEELKRVRPHLQRFPLHQGRLLLDAGARIESLYFPLAGVICLFAVMEDGRAVGLAVTGREGFLGVPMLLGDDTTPLRAVVLIDGAALKIGWDQARRELPAMPQLSAALRRYCSTYLAQLVQIGACHALHTVQQRVASWLLMARHCNNADLLPLTHESLSEVLGCRRSSVTEVLSELEAAGLISGGRGNISIDDAASLEKQACGCYALWRDRAVFR
ncbi:MAG: Crp/Fnr family transcriptional regulator [Candidatus Korobacteraceae bacterium]